MTEEIATEGKTNLQLIEDDLKAIFADLCPSGKPKGNPTEYGSKGEQTAFAAPSVDVYPEESLKNLEGPPLPYVAWRCDISFTGKIRFLGRTVHSGPHPQANDEQPPKKTLTLNGITLIREVDGSTEFLRYIEWYPFLTELGLLAAVRPVQTTNDLEGEEERLQSAQGPQAARPRRANGSPPE